MRRLTWDELTAGLDDIRKSPPDEGVLELLRLRGINAKVVQPGAIRVGDRARKL